ncbi:hypothetical protein DOC35_19530 [Salmonella enterica subsp. enterica]|nr:hypothetical protein [Salmonella enterica subsp. enterica]
MSQQKAAKLLAKALNNSSREEATAAFSRAWLYAEMAGVNLSSIHTITEEPAPITDDRERELVEKYNKLLAEAKRIKADREYYRQLYLNSLDGESEAEKKLERLKKYIKRL